MICLRNICINNLHKGDNDDNNNEKIVWVITQENFSLSARQM